MGSTKKTAAAAAVCLSMILAFAVAVGGVPLAPQAVSGGANAASLSALDAGGADKVASTVEISNLEDGETIYFAAGRTNVPLTVTSRVDDPQGTTVLYNWDGQGMAQSSRPPYAVVVPNLETFTTLTIMATATGYYNQMPAKGLDPTDTVTITTFQVDPTQIGSTGAPNNPFNLGLGRGDTFTNFVEVGGQKLTTTIRSFGGQAKGTFSSEGTVVTAADPDDASRSVTATVPAGLLTDSETGIALVQIANDLATLTGSTTGDAIVDNQPADGLVTDALYAEVSILVSTDGGSTFAEIDNARLAANPVTIDFDGTANTAMDALDIFSFSTDVSGPPIVITPAAAGNWQKRPTIVGDGTASAQVTSLSVFAPFNTPNDVAITGISNTTANSLNGSSQFYAAGGGTVEITLANAVGPNVDVIIGNNAPISATLAGNTVSVTVPAAANISSAPAETNVTVVDGATSDIAPNGLTYVGPSVDSVDVTAGPAAGGTAINIAGEGFASGLTADLGGAALAVGSVSGTSVAATTTANTAGLKDLTVTLSNGYSGSLADAFTYLPPPPVLTNVIPNEVFSDGGYKVRLEGMNFVTPETTFGQLAKINKGYDQYAQKVLFTQVNDVADESADDAAQTVRFLDDTRIDATTPVRGAGGEFDVYVSNNTLASVKAIAKGYNNYRSSLLPFTFNAGAPPFTIDSITPNTGPNTGGTEVTIVGTGFPTAKDAGITLDTKGSAGVTGHQIRMETTTVAGGSEIQVRFFYVRGTDLMDGDNFPAAINFAFSYDPAVLDPLPIANLGLPTDPANNNPVTGMNTFFWYGKTVSAGNPTPGTITVVVSGGSTEITTVNPVNTAESQNPFELGSFRFDVIGASNSQTALTIDPPGSGSGNEASMAASDASALTGVNVLNGLICVDAPDPCEIVVPPANVDVFFGPTMGTPVMQTKGTQSSVVVTTPAVFGDATFETDMMDRSALLLSEDIFPETGYAVDVRVQDRTDSSMFAISKDGFTYTLQTDPTINSFTPTTSWIFGGQRVTIQISGFTGVEPSNTTVLFGTDEAQVLSATDTTIEVVAPPNSSTNSPTVAQSEIVNISVTAGTKGGGQAMATSDDPYTYYRVREVTETVGTSTAPVTINALVIPAAGASFDLVFNPAGKRNTDFVSTEPGAVTLPALPIGKGLGSTVYGILRASKNTEVAGTDNLTTAPNAVGSPVGNIWNLDFHLYTDQFDSGDDSLEELMGVAFNTDGEDSVKVTFPTNDADLAQSELNGAALWATVGGSYNFGADASAGTYTPVATAPKFQDIVTNADTTTSLDGATNMTFVDSINNLDLYDVAQSSFTVVRNGFPPRSAFGEPTIVQENGSDPTAPISGTPAKTIEIMGDNIAWTESVVFQVGAKQSSEPIVPSNQGENDQLIQVVAPASPTGAAATADVILMVRTNGTAKQGVLTPINAGQVQFVGGQQNFPFLQLLAGLIAAVGLLAGGDSGGDGGGPCFVATAAYGTPMAGEIDALRSVRDSYLLNNAVGSMLVDGYYRISPAIADTVAKSPALAAVTRVALVPVIAIGKLLMAAPMATALLAAFAFIMTMKARRRAKAIKS